MILRGSRGDCIRGSGLLLEARVLGLLFVGLKNGGSVGVVVWRGVLGIVVHGGLKRLGSGR